MRTSKPETYNLNSKSIANLNDPNNNSIAKIKIEVLEGITLYPSIILQFLQKGNLVTNFPIGIRTSVIRRSCKFRP